MSSGDEDYTNRLWNIDGFKQLLPLLGPFDPIDSDIAFNDTALAVFDTVYNKKKEDVAKHMQRPQQGNNAAVLKKNRALMEVFAACNMDHCLDMAKFIHLCLSEKGTFMVTPKRISTEIQKLSHISDKQSTSSNDYPSMDNVKRDVAVILSSFEYLPLPRTLPPAQTKSWLADVQAGVEAWIRNHIGAKKEATEYMKQWPNSRVASTYNQVSKMFADTVGGEGKDQIEGTHRLEFLIAWYMLGYTLYYAMSDVDNWRGTFNLGGE